MGPPTCHPARPPVHSVALSQHISSKVSQVPSCTLGQGLCQLVVTASDLCQGRGYCYWEKPGKQVFPWEAL